MRRSLVIAMYILLVVAVVLAALDHLEAIMVIALCSAVVEMASAADPTAGSGEK